MVCWFIALILHRKNLLVAQETKHSEERKSFPRGTKVPRFIPEPEGDLYEEDQAANCPVDREWLQARFAEYMVTVWGEDVESGGCPSPDYGVCDHSD
ncbi:hypothetical protein BSKO_11067 [Bryopsis sp. KO-2023]|nr:hypothetical protein BSKO_11067 [Bryopsis sp. KO-2023]